MDSGKNSAAHAGDNSSDHNPETRMSSTSVNTNKATSSRVRNFKLYLENIGVRTDFEKLDKSELEQYLIQYFYEMRKASNGKENGGSDEEGKYKSNSLVSFRFSLARYLASFDVDLKTDPAFHNFRQAFAELLEQNSQCGLDENQKMTQNFPGHFRKLCQRLNEMRDNQDFCDLVLKVDGHEFAVHSCIVFAFSQTLDMMGRALQNMFITDKHTLAVETITAEAMLLILDFIYTGKLQLHPANVADMQHAACYLKITEVEQACQQYQDDLSKMVTESVDPHQSNTGDLPVPIAAIKTEKNADESEYGQYTSTANTSFSGYLPGHQMAPHVSETPQFSLQEVRSDTGIIQGYIRKNVSPVNHSEWVEPEEEKRIIDGENVYGPYMDDEGDLDYSPDDDDEEYSPKRKATPKKSAKKVAPRKKSSTTGKPRKTKSDPFVVSTDSLMKKKTKSRSLTQQSPSGTKFPVLMNQLNKSSTDAVSALRDSIRQISETVAKSPLENSNAEYQPNHNTDKNSDPQLATSSYQPKGSEEIVDPSLTPHETLPIAKSIRPTNLYTNLTSPPTDVTGSMINAVSQTQHKLTEQGSEGADDAPPKPKRRKPSRPPPPGPLTQEEIAIKSMINQAAMLSCKQCDAKFLRIRDLSIHIKDVHGKQKVVSECTMCGRTFVSLKLYERHIEEHQNQTESQNHSQKSLRCQKCDIFFTSSDDLTQHISVLHKAEVFVSYKCDECNKDFQSQLRSFVQHMATKHNNPKPFKCTYPKCSYAAAKPDSVDKHTHTVHLGKKMVQCFKCGSRYSDKHHLTEHLKKCNRELQFSCNVCDEPFYTKRKLVGHMKSHSVEPPLQCEECGKKVNDRNALVSHMQKIHSQKPPYRCDACDKTFKQYTAFKLHMRSAHSQLRGKSAETTETEDSDEQVVQTVPNVVIKQEPVDPDEESDHMTRVEYHVTGNGDHMTGSDENSGVGAEDSSDWHLDAPDAGSLAMQIKVEPLNVSDQSQCSEAVTDYVNEVGMPSGGETESYAFGSAATSSLPVLHLEDVGIKVFRSDEEESGKTLSS